MIHNYILTHFNVDPLNIEQTEKDSYTMVKLGRLLVDGHTIEPRGLVILSRTKYRSRLGVLQLGKKIQGGRLYRGEVYSRYT
jgi:hypothetical protein